MFSSTHELTLDPKNRLSIPSSVRAAMEPDRDGISFYIVPGKQKKTLLLYPDKGFERYADQLHDRLRPSPEKEQFETVLYALATPLEIDKQGRVVIPQRVMDQAGLSRRVVLSGKRDHLILWDHQAFQAFMDDHQPRLQDLLRQAELLSQVQINGSAGH